MMILGVSAKEEEEEEEEEKEEEEEEEGYLGAELPQFEAKIELSSLT
jgi:hypothetical protein